jgi:transcriptional regulator with GAF, ATPase, and Fis domain
MGRSAPDPSQDVSTAAHLPPAVACRLLAFWDRHESSFVLPDGGSVVLGRGRDAGIRLDHSSVSRRHAALHMGVPLEIEDLGSANGTRLDNRTVAPGQRLPVLLGSIIEVGTVRLVACSATDAYAEPEAAMTRVDQIVARVAPSDVSVILVGETGVGKEVVATQIHRRSARAAAPLLRINCGGLSEHLLESELFGHERGAFTGAVQTKPGLLEAATGGTVLLDEVGELRPATQVKLLRALENREVFRVGAVRPRAIDVRFIAATHRDLDVLVVLGQFRQDLLFRLNGITIQIPPLRERASQIPALAHELLADACMRTGTRQLELSANALSMIQSYRWPGNVRELRNVLDRAVLLCDGGRIEIEHIIFGKTGATTPPHPSGPPSVKSPDAAPLLATAPDPARDERHRILVALERCGGNQKEAAQLLGMSRRMLMYRLDRLGLPRPRKRSR